MHWLRRICAAFPSEYWRDLDKREAYPTAFVQAMTASGFLAALMPEEFRAGQHRRRLTGLR